MKENKREKILKRKNTKIVLFAIFLIIIAIGTALGVFFYLKSKSDNEFQKNPAVYYAIFDDGTYYIPKAESDIKFAIDSEDTNSYKVTNANGETVETSIINSNEKKYIQAKQKYTEGETYQVQLDNANFTEEALKDAKKVEFKIKEPQKAKYEMAENVVMVNSKDINVEDDSKIQIQNGSLKEGQIILVKDNNDVNNAYKVTTVEGDTVTVEKPEISEIYNNVDLYKEGKIDFDNLKINENAEVEIEKSIKESNLYKFLSTEVYAADSVSPKITFIANGKKMGINVELAFKADGEKKMGLDSLKEHNLIIKVSYEVSTDYIVDVKKDFTMNYDMAVKTTGGVEVELSSGNAYLKGISNISDAEYSKSVKEITQKLEKEVPDISENSIDIGAVEVPTGIPGINVYLDIYFQTQLSLQINLKYKGQVETIEHTGFVMNKNEKRGYKNITSVNAKHEFTAIGKAEIRVGIGIDGGISIINKDLAHAGVGVELGTYNEYFATVKAEYTEETNNLESGISARIELGVYLKVKLDCSIDVIFFKAAYSADLSEMKYPVFKVDTGVQWAGDEEQEQQNGNNNQQNSSNTSNSNSTNNKTNTGTENGVVGSLSINTDTDAIKAYKNYILSKKYINDYRESGVGVITDKSSLKDVGYCIFDINKDGIPEMIIDCVAGSDEAWKTDAIYTYNSLNKSVEKVDIIYNYGGITYEKNEKEIVYAEIRPNMITSYHGFYKLINNKLEQEKAVGYDRGSFNLEDGTYEYEHYMLFKNDTVVNITEEQERAYFNNVIQFSYQDITQVK